MGGFSIACLARHEFSGAKDCVASPSSAISPNNRDEPPRSSTGDAAMRRPFYAETLFASLASETTLSAIAIDLESFAVLLHGDLCVFLQQRRTPPKDKAPNV